MIDLHLHLDGSLSLDTIRKIEKHDSFPLSENDDEILGKIKAPKDCKDLNQYLSCFELPVALMQTQYSLELATYNLLKELNDDGLIYAEIRFAPQLHTRNGLRQENVVKSVLRGLNSALNELPIKANLILCCMRGENNQHENEETVRIAAEFLNNGVVATDLAGAEGIFPTKSFDNCFKLSTKLEVPFTLHAGEAAGSESVKDALDMGARRIGHGVRSIESYEILDILSKKRIPLELCPTSNLQTRVFDSIEDFPIKKFLEKDIVATINTDNITVSNTTIKNEFNLLKENLSLTNSEEIILLNNAISAAFISEAEKQLLRTKLSTSSL